MIIQKLLRCDFMIFINMCTESLPGPGMECQVNARGWHVVSTRHLLVLLGNKPQDMEYNWTLNKSTVHVHSAFSHNMIAPLNFERRLDSFREAPTYKKNCVD